MTPERVYALLVEANPVQDPGEFLERLDNSGDRLHLVESRRAHMKTEERFDAEQRTRTSGWYRGPAVAVASLMVVIAVAVVAILIGSNRPEETADQPVSNSQRALDAVDEFIIALQAGDIDAVAAVMEPQGELASSQRELWGFNAELLAAGAGFEAGNCTALAPDGASLVDVRCEITFANPLYGTLGLEELVMPFQYFTDTRRLDWRPFEGGDIAELNRTAVEYLRSFRPADYESNCDPSSYEFGSVVFDHGLALTSNCGRMLGPLFEDIARWVDDGRPLPTD